MDQIRVEDVAHRAVQIGAFSVHVRAGPLAACYLEDRAVDALPPFANVAYARAISSGLTASAPRPIAK